MGKMISWGSIKRDKLFWLLVVMCLAFRIAIWFSYKPIVYNDTVLYAQLASSILNLDFSHYLGERTPGYPLLLLLSGLNYQIVWLWQAIFGVLISLMLFLITLHQTERSGLALAVGLSYTLSVNQLFFEASILTETLSTFLLIASLFLIVIGEQKWAKKGVNYWLVIGIVVSVAILTRPIMLALVPLYLVLLAWRTWRRKMRFAEGAMQVMSFIGPVFLVVFGWSLFNKSVVDYFGLTTLSGYTWMEHSGRFIELVPDQYAEIKAVYLEYEEEQIKRGRPQTNTIWYAHPEMMTRTGLSYVELSAALNTMSMEMVARYPTLFAQNFVEMWYKFWEPANFWLIEEIKFSSVANFLQLIWYVQGIGWIIIKYLFWLVSLYYIFQLFRRQIDSGVEFNVLLIAIVFSVSVLQAVAGGYGDNHRYSIPFDPLILYVVLVGGWTLVSHIHLEKWSSTVSSRSGSTRRIAQNILIIILITFVALELFSRLLWWDRDLVSNLFDKEVTLLPESIISAQQQGILESWEADQNKYVQFDPVLGWSISPNVQSEQAGAIYSANSAGVRSLREYDLKKPSGIIRIGTFGPSFTHGDEVSDSETWQAQMEAAHPELEVMNWGVGGYGTDQAFLRYRTQGAAYQPDIVIIGFEEDNMRRNVNRFRPFFRRRTGTPLTKPVFVDSETEGFHLLDNPFESVEALQKAIQTPNAFLDLMCETDFYCDRARYQPQSLDIFYSYRFLRTLRYEINQSNQARLPAQLDPYAQRVNFLLLQQFVTEVVQNGAMPIILIFPEQSSMEAHERREETPYTFAIIALRENGLPVIDLAPAFVHAKTTDNNRYLDYYASDGGHYNALGNYIVSQTVLAYLCQQGVLQNCL